MKLSILILLSTLCFATTSLAQTLGETTAPTITDKTKEMGRDTKRAAKKAGNRVQEATCMKGDMKCEAEKEQNRAAETTEGAADEMKRK